MAGLVAGESFPYLPRMRAIRVASESATPRVFLGVFLLAASTLAFEILLTRVFSVTLWYHFAFVSISVAMIGMTAGALFVYSLPSWFEGEFVLPALSWSCVGLGLSIAIAITIHVLNPTFGQAPRLAPVLRLMGMMSIPFLMSGIGISVALTRFPQQVGRLYAADLVGAAVGCLIVPALLNLLDGLYACLAVAALACVAGAAFGPSGRPRLASLTAATALALVTLAGADQDMRTALPWRIRSAKGFDQSHLLYEKWNSFSRVTIHEAKGDSAPLAWSLSAAYPGQIDLRHDWLMIDAWAGTPILHTYGDLQKADYLKYDVTSFAYRIRPRRSVLIVGSGGGRDILTARLFDSQRIVAVEINGNILRALKGPFAAATGHLDHDPRVQIVNDEARSYTARQTERFELIQLSFIDTFAATAAGAFVLAENSLYTVEAWKCFLEHLEDGGVLSVSRASLPMTMPGIYRMMSLAREALSSVGIHDPERHLVVVANQRAKKPPSWGPLATLLVSRTPFSESESRQVSEVAEALGFDVLYAPRTSRDPILHAIATGSGLQALHATFPLKITAPTDDSPFFFNMLRVSDWFSRPPTAERFRLANPNLQAVSLVTRLLALLGVVTLTVIVVPLRGSAAPGSAGSPIAYLIFFCSIGLGFMLFEISQMQRLTVFLGHPIYGITVILFVLLLSAGIGSRVAAGVPDRLLRRNGLRYLLLCSIVGFGLTELLPFMSSRFADQPTWFRILTAIAMLAPLGFVLGTPFTIGMRASRNRWQRFTPWFWAVNGAASVTGSVLAVVSSLALGISATGRLAALCYLAAALSFLRLSRADLADLHA